MNAVFAPGLLWSPGGVPVCIAAGEQSRPVIAPDGTGGCYVAWQDLRSGADWDIYLQRIGPLGTPLWQAGGIQVCGAPGHQSFPKLVEDGSGGTFVVWADERDGPTRAFATRVLSNGVMAEGWSPTGNSVLESAGSPSIRLFDTASDGSGGVYVVVGAATTRVQRLGSNGVPVQGWPSGGLIIVSDVVSDPLSYNYRHHEARISPGSAGDFWLSWYETASWYDRFGYPYEYFAGNLQLRGPGGSVKAATNFEVDRNVSPVPIESDEVGGLLFARSNTWMAFGRFSPAAQSMWQSAGLGFAAEVAMLSDGAGGLLFAWVEYPAPGQPVRASRIGPTGLPDPAWPVGGRVISDPAAVASRVSLADLVPGRLVAVWAEADPGGSNIVGAELSVQDGSPVVWPAGGVLICGEARDQSSPVTTRVAGGVVAVAWKDLRTDTGDIYVQALSPDAPVPVAITNVSAELVEGVIRLRWYSATAVTPDIGIERRSPDGDWRILGKAEVRPGGWIEYADDSIERGQRYGYRLRIANGDDTGFAGETWIEVPGDWQLAMLAPGVVTGGSLGLVLELPASSQADLEVFDLQGRLECRLRLTDVVPGQRTVDLPNSGRGRGVRWLRLTQDKRSVVRRVVDLR